MKTLNIYRLVSPDVSSQIPQYPVTHVTQSGAHRHIHLSSSAPESDYSDYLQIASTDITD